MDAHNPTDTFDEALKKHFSGDKAVWKESYDELAKKVKSFGGDASIDPSGEYIRFLRKDKTFAIIEVTPGQLDIGIQIKDVSAAGRFKLSGTWNEFVTHRVQITDTKQIDEELSSWLHQSYERIK